MESITKHWPILFSIISLSLLYCSRPTDPTPILTLANGLTISCQLGSANNCSNQATSSIQGGAISYSVANASVASVDQFGTITPLSVGTTQIMVTQAAVPGKNVSVTVTFSLTVTFPLAGTGVFVSGYLIVPPAHSGASTYATYWKNGVITKLDSIGSTTNAINVSDETIYVCGNLFWQTLGVYWTIGRSGINKVACQGAMEGYSGESSTSMVVSASNVYVSGYESSKSLPQGTAKYWVNGVKYDLYAGDQTGNPNPNSKSYSIYVAGQDVFATIDGPGSGFTGNPSLYLYSGYNKNGALVILPNCNSSNSIFVSASDVYVAGTAWNDATHQTTSAAYWKNGVPYALTNGTNTTSIFVSGSDVYVSGMMGGQGGYWKNQTFVSLPGCTLANSIIVSDSDVYVAGQQNNAPAYWKNGTVVILGTSGVATSIFIVK